MWGYGTINGVCSTMGGINVLQTGDMTQYLGFYGLAVGVYDTINVYNSTIIIIMFVTQFPAGNIQEPCAHH